ncbi:MAG: hypothetical protein M3040_18280 [Bacteroidota bacterium]|nr:hypothetical protein [Bacteroidota bacterium]
MKALQYLSIIIAGLFLFVACQKELSLESGFAGKVASGSLLDSAGNCQMAAISGVYMVDSSLGGNNYVTVRVNIATAGSYRIFTDTQNGFSFQDSGVVVAGVQMIQLKATGRPILAKSTTFNVVFDTSFCSFTVTVIGKTPGTFTLAGSPGSCSSANVKGIYTTGIPLTTNNKVDLQVNVTALGSYNVTTTPVAGISFSGSGNFTTLGPQTITLQGTGTPTKAGTNAIPVSAGGSNCSFNVTVAAGSTGNSAINDSDTAWQFTAGGKVFHGPFYDVFDTLINGAKGIIFFGYTLPRADTTIQFGAFSATGSFANNQTYSSKLGLAAYYFTDYVTDTSGVNIYTANPPSTTNPTPAEDMKITIATYDSTTRFVSGTFTGTALNAAKAAVPITNGRFRAHLR